MADPRGRGFARGRGKWHAERPRILTPLAVDWTFDRIEQGRMVYTREGYELRFIAEENGWFVNRPGERDGTIYREPGWDFVSVTADLFCGNLYKKEAAESDGLNGSSTPQ